MEKYTYITAGTLSHSAVHVYLRLSHLTTKHYYSYGQWTPSLAGVDSLRVLISNHNNSSFTLCKQLLFPRAISHSPSQLLSRLLMASVYHNILSGRFSPLHLTDSHSLRLTVHPPTQSPATYLLQRVDSNGQINLFEQLAPYSMYSHYLFPVNFPCSIRVRRSLSLFLSYSVGLLQTSVFPFSIFACGLYQLQQHGSLLLYSDAFSWGGVPRSSFHFFSSF